MRRLLLLLPLIAMLVALSVMSASADGQAVQFQQTFTGTTGNVDFFEFGLMCDECFDDDLDTDSGYSAIGSEIGIEGNFNWTATNDSVLAYDDAGVRQGSDLGVLTTTIALPGTATVNYHVYGTWGLFNDPDGDAMDYDYNPTNVTQGVGAWFTSSIPCALPLQGGVTTCSKDEYFEIASIGFLVPPVWIDLKMRLKVETEVTIDSTGVIGVRVAAVDAGLPIPDAPITYSGGNPGAFVDSVFIACNQPAGENLTYSLKNMRLDADSVVLDHSAMLNFAVLVNGVTDSEIDTPGINFTEAHFNDGVTLTTDDLNFDFGPVQPDITPPTIEDLPFFIGWEGSPIQFSADVTDNCGAPTLKWEFSDGGVAFGPNPEHVFPDNGLYTGMLTATDVTGLTTTTTFTVTVLNKAPEANAGPDALEAWGIPVPFNAQAVDPGAADQGTLSYAWDFGDNSPMGHAKDTTHAYTTPGTYTATLTVCDKEGSCDTDERTITIRKRNTSLGYLGSHNWTHDTQATLSASLVDEFGQPVNGRPIDFSVGMLSAGGSATNSMGVAERGYNVVQAAGTYGVQANFAGDTLYEGAANQSTVNVAAKGTNLTYTGALKGAPKKTVTLSAVLKDADGKPLAGRTVEFTIGTQSVTAVTDANGVAIATLKLDQKQGTYALTATWTPSGGDADKYSAAADVESFKLSAK